MSAAARRRLRRGLASLLIAWLAAPHVTDASDRTTTASDVIREIRFVGNRKTRPQTMLQEMTIRVGDPADAKEIARSRQAIMDLELFQSVQTELLPAEGGGYVLEVRVKEKHYFLALPTLSRSADGDISYGAQLRMDNVAGLNQRLNLRFKLKELADGDIDERRTYSIAYRYPRIRGSPYQIDVEALRERLDIQISREALQGFYLKRARSLEFDVSRWYRLAGPSRGWRLKGGLLWRDIEYQHLSGDTGLFSSGRVAAVRAGVEYANVHDYLYSRRGREFGYRIEVARDLLGSDIDYTKHDLYYRAYIPVLDRPHTNLNLQLRLGAATRNLFGEQFYSIGGSSTLRGFGRDTVKGNTQILFNAEFLTPVFNNYAARAVIFLDAGNVYEDLSDMKLTELKSSVGFGLRWKIKSFVRLDLRADLAYAIDTKETKLLAGTERMF